MRLSPAPRTQALEQAAASWREREQVESEEMESGEWEETEPGEEEKEAGPAELSS